MSEVNRPSNELLPCPFCGDAQLSTVYMTSFDGTPPRKWKRVKCDTCGAMAPDTAWNQRAADEPSPAPFYLDGLSIEQWREHAKEGWRQAAELRAVPPNARSAEPPRKPQFCGQNACPVCDGRSSEPPSVARPLAEWHEDIGDVVWWKFPMDESAYIGSPISSDWPGYHTHWTPHPALPSLTKGVAP